MRAHAEAVRRESVVLPPDDAIEALLGGAAAGDESSLAALYDATHRKVFGLCLRILRDHSLAEEAVVDVFTQVWRHASRFDASRGNGLTWLLTLARSRAIDLRRSRASRTRVEVDLDFAAPQPSPEPGPEQSALADARARQVRRALDALPPAQREAIEAAFYRGLTHTEVAEVLGKPLGTVKSRLRLALVALREALDHHGVTPS